MSGVHEYKCPHCGGKLTFDSSLQEMKCPYCDSVIDIESLKHVDDELNNFSEQEKSDWENPGKVWQEDETSGMRVYICNSCGGQIIGDENMAATKCPYCDNPVVLMGQFKGDLKPDYVIPFKLDKEAAKAAYLQYLKGKPLLPRLFKDKNHIDEIKGLYVPFWLFDAKANGEAMFKATKVRMWRDSRFQHTDTSYYSVTRKGNMNFQHVPVDGSTNMPDELMQSIEPYDFSDAVDFKTAYLSGFLADRYDQNAETSMNIADERIKQSTLNYLKSTVNGYNTVTLEQGNVNLNNAKEKYAMYPVWILNTTYNNEHYLFAMNGQTGKMVGNLPIDKGKLWLYRLLWTGIIGVVIFLILMFLIKF